MLNDTTIIKAITPVRAVGAGNNGNWVVRVRHIDGTEIYGGLGAGMTLAQAQHFIVVNPDNRQMRHPLTGENLALAYHALPPGVSISTK